MVDYVDRAKKGDRLIICNINHFRSKKIFKARIEELNEFLKEQQMNYRSTPSLETESDKYFVRIFGLRDVKLWDIAGVIK